MDEINDADDDINDGKLLFIGEIFFNGEISLKEAEFSQKNLEKK